MNKLVMKYLAENDVERAALMYIFTMALSWNKDQIARLYDFDNEMIIPGNFEKILGFASSGEARCMKLAVVLFNGGYGFRSDEINITELFRGLDQKRFNACIEALEIRFGYWERVFERYQKKPEGKGRLKEKDER